MFHCIEVRKQGLSFIIYNFGTPFGIKTDTELKNHADNPDETDITKLIRFHFNTNITKIISVIYISRRLRNS